MDPPPSKTRGRSTGTAPAPAAATTSITDVDADVLVRCAGYLTPREVSSMAMSCKFLKRVAYSDAVWHRLYRSVGANGVRRREAEMRFRLCMRWMDRA